MYDSAMVAGRLAREPRRDCGQDVAGFVPFTPAEAEETVAARFARQARRHAARPAVVTSTARRTYAELDRNSNRIAYAVLREGGAGAESVAVLLDSDVEIAEAFLALLKVGKRFVPIDPRVPQARAATMVADAEARLVITDAGQRARVAGLASSPLRVIDVGALDGLPDGAPPVTLPLDADAWIVYTSGSTGRPKGVLQTQRNLMHYMGSYVNGLRISPEDRLTALFTMLVNGGLHDLLISLVTGGCFCPWHAGRDGIAGLSAWLRGQRTTVLTGVATPFRHWAATLDLADVFPDVRLIRLGGEPMYRRDFEAYRRHFAAGSCLVNRLGSTESGTLRWMFLDHEAVFEGNSVPVGWAQPDAKTLLLDEDGREVAPGEVGEVVAVGPYLSPGYWRRPDLTAAAFSTDADGGGARRYRTGDLGRLLPDGSLVPMGRKDTQVKIRGTRVEVDEIEQTLLRHPGVREAAVVGATDPRDQETRLIAYVVATTPPPTVTALRRTLGFALPPGMMPSAFVFLAGFPQAPNGKVNRRALPAPDLHRPVLDVPYRAAATELERALTGIWQEILGLDAVGADDPFVDLGGDSLRAMQVLARVRQLFGVDLPLSAVLSVATVADMTRLMLDREARPAPGD